MSQIKHPGTTGLALILLGVVILLVKPARGDDIMPRIPTISEKLDFAAFDTVAAMPCRTGSAPLAAVLASDERQARVVNSSGF